MTRKKLLSINVPRILSAAKSLFTFDYSGLTTLFSQKQVPAVSEKKKFSDHLTNTEFDFTFHYPKPAPKNPLTGKVEGLVPEYVSQNNLYQKHSNKKAYTEGLFAHLKGWIYPTMKEEPLKVNTFYTTILFDNDDLLDDVQNFDFSDMDIQLSNQQMVDACKGVQPKSDWSPRAKALSELYKTHLSRYQETQPQDYQFFVSTLGLYLNSTRVEKFYSAPLSDDLDPEEYLTNRRHSGGCLNILALAFLTEGLDFQSKNSSFPTLQYMMEAVVDIVGIVNDIYSFPKELRQVRLQMEKDNLDKKDGRSDRRFDNPDDLRSYLKNNLVFLLWKDRLGKPKGLEESLQIAQNLYTAKLKSYYKWKSGLDHHLSTDTELQKIVTLFDGWNAGHLEWALKESKRYK